jgi:DNA-directed RNA polymerase specialized sigma24 family protein
LIVPGKAEVGFLRGLNVHALGGRREACAGLVRVHYQAVYRLLVHLTRDAHQAEDLTQETFAAAWEKIGRFQGNASLATWLHRIAYSIREPQRVLVEMG